MLCETQLGIPTLNILFSLCSGIRTRVLCICLFFRYIFLKNPQCFFYELEPLMSVKSTQLSYINSNSPFHPEGKVKKQEFGLFYGLWVRKRRFCWHRKGRQVPSQSSPEGNILLLPGVWLPAATKSLTQVLLFISSSPQSGGKVVQRWLGGDQEWRVGPEFFSKC